MSNPELESRAKVLRRAMQITFRYGQSLHAAMISEINKTDNGFREHDSLHSEGTSVLEKYYEVANVVWAAEVALRASIKRIDSSRKAQLESDEIMCFQCRALIPPEANSCSECGWTWMRSSV